MSMDLSHESWLVDLIDNHKKNPEQVPPGFEENFICDIAERFSTEGVEIFISHRMMKILVRIGEERYGMQWAEYQ